MSGFRLRKKHRNALMEVVRATGLDPRRFSPEELTVFTVIGDKPVECYRIRLEDSGIYFAIATQFSGENQTFGYAMTPFQLTDRGPAGKLGSWSMLTPDFKKVEQGFENWLRGVGKKYFAYREEEEEDLAIPDLWVELKSAPDSVEDFRLLKNTRFSADEQTRIADTLTQFEVEVERRQLLSPDEIQELHEQVNYLVDASKRLGRKDWVMVATGTLFSFTLQAGLSGVTASQLLQLATGGLQWIVTHAPLLTP